MTQFCGLACRIVLRLLAIRGRPKALAGKQWALRDLSDPSPTGLFVLSESLSQVAVPNKRVCQSPFRKRLFLSATVQGTSRSISLTQPSLQVSQ